MKRLETGLMLGIFFCALLLRMYALCYLPLRPVTDDAFEYNYIAQNIGKAIANQHLEDKNTFLYFGAKRGWLYPLFIAGVYKLFGPDAFFVRLAQAIIDSLTCLLIYFIGKDIFNKKAGVCAALIASLYPGFIYYSTMLYQETTALFLIALFVLILTRALAQKKPSLFLCAGVLTVIVSFYRSGFLFFALLTTVALLAALRLYYKRCFTKHVLSFLSGACGMFILYGIFSYALCGAFNFNKPSIAWSFYETIHRDGWVTDTFAPTPTSELVEAGEHYAYPLPSDKEHLKLPPAVYMKAGILLIQKQPLQFLSQLIKRLQRMWAYIETYPGKWHSGTVLVQLIFHRALIIVALIGMPLAARSWHQSWPLFLIVLYVTGAYIPIIGIPRYALTAVPSIIIFAAYGLVFITGIVGKQEDRLLTTKLFLLAFPLTLLLVIFTYLDVALLLLLAPHLSPKACHTIHSVLVNLSFITAAYCLYQMLTPSTLKTYHRFAVTALPLVAVMLFYTHGSLTSKTWQEWQCPLQSPHQSIRQTIFLPDDFNQSDYRKAALMIDMFGGGGNTYDFNVLLNGVLVKKYTGGLKAPEGKFDGKFFGLYKSFLFDGYKLKPEDLRQWYEIDLPLAALNRGSPLTIECFLSGQSDAVQNFVLVFGDYTTLGKHLFAGPCFPRSDADTSMVKIMPYDGDSRLESITPLQSKSSESAYHDGLAWRTHDLSSARGMQSGSYRMRVELITRNGSQFIL